MTFKGENLCTLLLGYPLNYFDDNLVDNKSGQDGVSRVGVVVVQYFLFQQSSFEFTLNGIKHCALHLMPLDIF